MANTKPVAFISFVGSDFQHDEGGIPQFRERLADEVSMHTGEELSIFHDRDDALWAQVWKERVEESVDRATFLIAFITPRFFSNPQCRSELRTFLEREKKLGRNDLILPLYYVRCPLLHEDERLKDDQLARDFDARHGEEYIDWRELRFEPFSSPEVGKRLQDVAIRIHNTLSQPQSPTRMLPINIPRMSELKQSLWARNQAPAPSPQPTESEAELDETMVELEVDSGPPTRVVDPMGRADHVTISEAINEAASGDRILVRPGLYQETLVIDNPLEIIGDGDLDDIVVQAVGANAVLFKTTMGRVANLTLRQQNGGEWFCVNAVKGRLFLEDCDITSRSLACVGISGGADPRLRRNQIHGGKQSGVLVYDNGLGTLEDNAIYSNGLSGVEVKTGGSPTLQGNRIYENQESGVYIYDEGRGHLEDNDIFRNARAGMRIGNSGRPILRKNRINQNGIVAIWSPLKGGGDIEENDLRGNAYGAWKVSDDSEPLLKRSGNLE